MAKTAKKRYVVNFVKRAVDVPEAAGVLSRSAASVKDGVDTMMTAEIFTESDDVQHFPELGMSALSLSDQEVKDLEKDSRIKEVIEDFEVKALPLEEASVPSAGPEAGKEPIPWNISMVGADKVWGRVTGRGVKLAVIDTGIDGDHPDLTVSGGASFVPGVTSWEDDQGHGTHCAGIAGARYNSIGVVGVAPNVSLYAVKVLNSKGSGMFSWILAGMGWAARNNMDIVSMSLGSDVDKPDVACPSMYVDAAEELIREGCLPIAAAGNSGRGPNRWVGLPARCAGFVAVAAVDDQGLKADFSSWGPGFLVSLSAPGARIYSTYVGGGYRTLSGTSMACPHVSGAAALIRELRPTWTPDRIRQRLIVTTKDLGAPGNDEMFGAGLLDCHAAVYNP